MVLVRKAGLPFLHWSSMATYTCPSNYRSGILIKMVHGACESAPFPNLLLLTKKLLKNVSFIYMVSAGFPKK